MPRPVLNSVDQIRNATRMVANPGCMASNWDVPFHVSGRMNKNFNIELATAADQESIFDLVRSVFEEFGYDASTEHGEADLLDLEGYYFSKGGQFWIAKAEGRVVGTHGYLPLEANSKLCTFRRLYVHKDFRGTCCGFDLMQATVDWAKQEGMSRLEFWSDTKFKKAHQFFERFGLTNTGELREMHDGIQPYSEYRWVMDL